MDDRLRRKVLELAQGLASEEHERLEEAGMFIDLETLTARIGDELARQLANIELTRRADATAAHGVAACPECGQECPLEPEREPLILQGMRGDIESSEPRCHCTRCRRDFPLCRAASGARCGRR